MFIIAGTGILHEYSRCILLVNRNIHCAILLASSIFFAAHNWLEIGSFWGDPARSLFEIYRASRSEIPYRDFTFQYPPLTIFLLGTVLQFFGATFKVAQIAYDLLSLGCVFALWFLARRLAQPVPALLVTLALIMIGANGSGFALFSLEIYTPSILFGASGLALALAGLVDLPTVGMTRSTVALLIGGGLIGCLSRLEAIAGICAALLCLSLVAMRSPDRRNALMRVFTAAVLLLLPSLATYAALAVILGSTALLQGMTGYGQAAGVCPWWPNGFGALGGVAAICAAVASMVLAERIVVRKRVEPPDTSSVAFTPFAPASYRRRAYAWLGIAAALVWLVYTMVVRRPFESAHSHGAVAIARYLTATDTFTTPLMWACCVLFAAELWMYSRSRTHDDMAKISLVVLSVIAAVSVRSLFGSTISRFARPPDMTQAFLFVTFPFILYRMFQFWAKLRGYVLDQAELRRIEWLACAILCIFGAAQIARATVKSEAEPYITINTDAGPVKVSDNLTSARVYQFLKVNSLPEESIADVAYGGGVNFALHRAGPLYSTQFVLLRPTVLQRERDAAQLAAAQTRFVISRIPPVARYGNGIGCACPRLVWEPSPPPGDALELFPLMTLIEQRYQPVMRLAPVVIYSRRF